MACSKKVDIIKNRLYLPKKMVRTRDGHVWSCSEDRKIKIKEEVKTI